MAFSLSFENPILTKELRTRMRGAKAFWILLLYLGVLSLILGGTYLSWLASQAHQGDAATQSYDMGRLFYGVLFTVQAALVGLITPALTSGALSIEREQRTFEALSVSPLPRKSIVLGKLLSAVGFVGLLLCSSLPLVSLCFLMGGVSPQEVGAAYILLMASAFLYGATGIAFSSFAKNTTTATVLTYGTILIFFFATLISPLASLNFSTAAVNSYSRPFLLGVNPVGAMVAGSLTERYYGLNIPSWLVGIVINGFLGAILTIVALHRIEYPRTDRSALLRGLSAGFLTLLTVLSCGEANRLEGAGVGLILAPIVLVPLFVAGEGLGSRRVREQALRLRTGSPVSGLVFVVLVLVACAAFLPLGLLHAENVGEGWSPVYNFVRHALPMSLVMLCTVFGFGSLTLLLSQKLKNRWGAMALSVALLAAVYFLPMTSDNSSYYDAQAPVWVNTYCLSPLVSIFSLENSQPRITKALLYAPSSMWWINCLFTSTVGIFSLALLKRSRAR